MVGKKSAVGDRPASRKHETPVEWKRLPFATAPVLTAEDAAAQRATVSDLSFRCTGVNDADWRATRQFLEIWSEDGVSAEPEDDQP